MKILHFFVQSKNNSECILFTGLVGKTLEFMRELKHWSHCILGDLNYCVLILNTYKTMDLNVVLENSHFFC